MSTTNDTEEEEDFIPEDRPPDEPQEDWAISAPRVLGVSEDLGRISDYLDFNDIPEPQDWASSHPEDPKVSEAWDPRRYHSDLDHTSEYRDWDHIVFVSRPSIEFEGWDCVLAPRNFALPHPTALLCFSITFEVGTDLPSQGLVEEIKGKAIIAAEVFMNRTDQSEIDILRALIEILSGRGASVKEELESMTTNLRLTPYIQTCAMLLLWTIVGVDEAKLKSYRDKTSSYDIQSLFLVREFATVREMWDERPKKASRWALGAMEVSSLSTPPEKKLFIRMASGYCNACLNREEEAGVHWREAKTASKGCFSLPQSWIKVLEDS